MRPLPLMHPFTDMYYYPGHSFSPLQYISLESLPPGHTEIALYALDNTDGRIDLNVVMLRYVEEDKRIKDMRRSLYPGAILQLPSPCYTRKHDSSFTLNVTSDSLDHEGTPVEEEDQPRRVSFITIEFRYAGPDNNDKNQKEKSGRWRTEKQWGDIVRDSKARDEFEKTVLERIQEFVDNMERNV